MAFWLNLLHRVIVSTSPALQTTSVAAIRFRCWLAPVVRRQAKPSAWVMGAIGAIAATTQVLKAEAVFGDKVWQGATPLNLALIVSGVAVIFGWPLVTLVYARLAAAAARDKDLYAVVRDLVHLLQDELKVTRTDVGVHVWTVRGVWGARYLDRCVTYPDRPATPIIWRKSKGAIGRAWAERDRLIADLESLREQAPNESAWKRLSAGERFDLTWAEAQKTRKYRAVLAIPLYRTDDVRRVRGCLSIDLTVDGKADALRSFSDRPTLLGLLSLCERVLSG